MFDNNIINELKELLIGKQESLSVAESVTSGFIQAALSTAENASQFFEGGITTYNLEQKVRHLNINQEHAQEVDCVSQQVSEEMAVNCAKLFKSTWALAITGYASPVPEGGNKLFAHYAVSKNGQVLSYHYIESRNEPGLPTQLYFTNEVLRHLLELVKKEKAPLRGASN
jgi:PncC family amidohydrolase